MKHRQPLFQRFASGPARLVPAALWARLSLLITFAVFSAIALHAAPLSAPWTLPAGNYVTHDGKGYLAIRPGGRVYVRRDGEDRFTLYRTKVRASVRNEYWLERVGAVTRTGATDAPPPGAIEPRPDKSESEKSKNTKGTATEKPAAAKSRPSFFARLFGKSDSEASPKSDSDAEARPETKSGAEEVDAKLATAWFTESTRLVFIFGNGELGVLIFQDDVLKGKLKFRRIKFRLAVPDHARE